MLVLLPVLFLVMSLRKVFIRFSPISNWDKWFAWYDLRTQLHNSTEKSERCTKQFQTFSSSSSSYSCFYFFHIISASSLLLPLSHLHRHLAIPVISCLVFLAFISAPCSLLSSFSFSIALFQLDFSSLILFKWLSILVSYFFLFILLLILLIRLNLLLVIILDLFPFCLKSLLLPLFLHFLRILLRYLPFLLRIRVSLPSFIDISADSFFS